MGNNNIMIKQGTSGVILISEYLIVVSTPGKWRSAVYCI